MATELRSYAYPGGIAGNNFTVGGGLLGQNGNGNASGQFLFVALIPGVQDTFDVYRNDNALSGRVPLGVSQNDPPLNGQLSIMCLGRSKIVAGLNGIVEGQEVGADANGRAVAKAATLTGANLGDFVIGVCSCAAAQGEVGSIELIGRYRV